MIMLRLCQTHRDVQEPSFGSNHTIRSLKNAHSLAQSGQRKPLGAGGSKNMLHVGIVHEFSSCTADNFYRNFCSSKYDMDNFLMLVLFHTVRFSAYKKSLGEKKKILFKKK